MLFDTPQKEQRSSKVRRYVITGVAALVLAYLAIWYWPFGLRYYHDKDTVRHFLNEVAAGNMQEAYKLWKPSPSYSFNDFLQDWGPSGYYGPVRSYRIERTTRRSDSNGVDVIVEVSPAKPFPSGGADQSSVKEVDLGVRLSDQSISFPPPAL